MTEPYERPIGSALQRLVTTIKAKAPAAMAMLRRDSVSSDSGTVSDPDTPMMTMSEEDYQNSFLEVKNKTETTTSELLRKVSYKVFLSGK